jgi:2-polyprenyl-3-methyl-5-hydroxy-6-metoxy-1,4-benzoquinol methylase
MGENSKGPHMTERTILVDEYRKASNLPVNSNAYKGLRIHALPGLHEFLAAKATEQFTKGATVADLAAGSGAMCLRLFDLGFAPMAVDYVAENFKAIDIPFEQADLNEDFSQLLGVGRFDAIMASEIIEHLENPRHFARQCFKALAPGGRLILSTPNVQSPGSVASFLRAGHFLWFSDRDYIHQGHISPLTHWQIQKSFAEAGFNLLWTGSFGDKESLLAGSPRLKLLSWLLSLFSDRTATPRGEIYVCVLEKPTAG